MSRILGSALAGAITIARELSMFPPGAGGPGGPGGFPGAPGGFAPPQMPGAPAAPQAPGLPTATGGGGGMMSTTPRPSVGGDWPEGDLPAQMGGTFHVLYPGVSTFVLPVNLAQLWKWEKSKDNNPRSQTFGQEVDRIYLDFDKSNPLVIVAGRAEDIGQSMTGRVSGNPRARGKRDNPTTPYVSDLAYLLEVSLKDTTRPTGPDVVQAQMALAARINLYAGQPIRLEHGLNGYCNPNKAKRLILGYDSLQANKPIYGDAPNGAKGCDESYYTDAFKVPAPTSAKAEDLWDTEVVCQKVVNTATGEKCSAIVRGWPRIERFLPPAGQ